MRFLSWNCKLRTRLSDIVLMHLHIHNNYRQIVTQQVQKRFFYNVILKCFQNHRRGKRCKLFSFLSKWFGNLKKDVVNKRLVNSVKYHYLCTYQCKSRGGGGECRQGVGIWCLRLAPCRAFDRAKGPRGRDIWFWPTEAWYQFRSSYQIRPSRLSESHAVGERCEVFICFNRQNLIL